MSVRVLPVQRGPHHQRVLQCVHQFFDGRGFDVLHDPETDRFRRGEVCAGEGESVEASASGIFVAGGVLLFQFVGVDGFGGFHVFILIELQMAALLVC